MVPQCGTRRNPHLTKTFLLCTAIFEQQDSSGITITQASGVTLRLAGAATSGNRTLAQRGLATLIKVGTDEWIASGMGIS